jgi:hypothetical protein
MVTCVSDFKYTLQKGIHVNFQKFHKPKDVETSGVITTYFFDVILFLVKVKVNIIHT